MSTVREFSHSSFCFVFGSNLAGKHGAGAALTAKRFYGAKNGLGEGLSGSSYALPTKNMQLVTLPIADIQQHCFNLFQCAKLIPDKVFQVTRVGCGLAGYTDDQIAPLLIRDKPANVVLPRAFYRAVTPLEQRKQFRIVVAGSRSFSDYSVLKEKIDYVVDTILPEWQKPVVVSGGARGADLLGERYARERGYDLVRFPACWDKFGKSAGFLRNSAMAWYADMLVAFWDKTSPGTAAMIDSAKSEGLQVVIVQTSA
jgi:hypothetical protein